MAAGQVGGQGVGTVQQQFGDLRDLGRLGQASLAGVGAREPPARGIEDDGAAAAQGSHILGRCGVFPHLGVHRRGEQHRAARRQQRVREQVVGEAVRRAGEQIGGGRRDND